MHHLVELQDGQHFESELWKDGHWFDSSSTPNTVVFPLYLKTMLFLTGYFRPSVGLNMCVFFRLSVRHWRSLTINSEDGHTDEEGRLTQPLLAWRQDYTPISASI